MILTNQAVLDLPLTGVALIEASAGTGKTHTIANLYLRHVVAGREVGELLVVTFTRAATDELRGRIRARLFQALDLLERGTASDDGFLAALIDSIRAAGERDLVGRRLRLAVRAMDEAAIYTIHSFCQRALTEFAFNSGQQFQLEVLADDQDLWRQAVEDWWRRIAYPLPPHRARLLLSALGGRDAFAGLLEPLLRANPHRLLPQAGCVSELLSDFDAIQARLGVLASQWQCDGERLKAILRQTKALKRNRECDYGERLEGVLAVVDAWAADPGSALPPAELRALTLGGLRANAKARADDPDLEDPFFLACTAVLDDLDRFLVLLRAAALREAADDARARVRTLKDKVQALSYDDLLTRMQDALADEGGSELAAGLRQRFPVAMIDEFQDTDPVQYAIFRAIYLSRPECGLTMIGDPKQAIYSFRGGDIFTYMEAKSDTGAGAVHTLATNWRSTPELVGVVNGLFLGRPRDAFVYGGSIPFEPAVAADRDHAYLGRGGRRQQAMTLWALPQERKRNGEPKALSKDRAGELAHAAVADEIARLIDEGRHGRATIGARPLVPRDIAVLVRGGAEARALREVLADAGVMAVSVGRDGVYASEEAAALEVLLEAILEPRDRGLARLALTSPLLGLDYPAVVRISAEEAEWADWVERLLVLRETWQRRGFMAMFQQMLRSLGLASAIARGGSAERRLTNLLHLGELLAQGDKTLSGMDALLSWYRSQRQESAAEETVLRLESDADLVQIVTIHSSKGLQYPVVFVPYLWACRPRRHDEPVPFHQGGDAWLDIGSEHREAHLLLAEQERVAEDVRLVYVALTRAECAIYLVWGRVGTRDGRASQTALGYLLHRLQSGAGLAEELPDCFNGAPDLMPDLEALATRVEGRLLLAPIPTPDPPFRVPPADAPPRLAARRFRGEIRTDWRLASFSSLTRNLHQTVSLPREEAEDDPALRFPAGSHVGSYLHLLLEAIDFQGDVRAQVMEHSPCIAPRFNLDHGRWGADAATLLARAIETPIDTEGLRLADIPTTRRLNELEFDFATGLVDLAALDRLLAQAAGRELPALQAETFRGMVTGVIDLVLEHRGRYYIADYKSNWLGGRLAHYAPQALRRAVYERRYDLQYLLYTLALHRYLGRRLVDYDYECHFGGVYYLFLRGMRPQTGPACGIYRQRPAYALVQALDRQVFSHDPEAAR